MSIAGLNATQEKWARAILTRVHQRNAWPDVGRICITVALTESSLLMYANSNNPESLQLPHDAVGSDHGSVGLYQQQVGGAVNSTANWGTTAQCMDLNYSTDIFMQALYRLSGWQTLPLYQAAQEVQGSYDPTGGNYRKNMVLADTVVTALWPQIGPPPPAPAHPPAGTYTVQSGDTLTKIAYHYPQSWITADSISRLNHLANPDDIAVGQRLVIG